MLRGREISRAALVLALALLWASTAAADQTIGGSCTSSSWADSAQSTNGNNAWCNGTTWQYPAYQHGSTTASCSSTTAGTVQYTSGGVLEACIATGGSYSWIPIDSGMHFISTQTASSSASLQFTSLPTSYNTLFVNCAGLHYTTTGGGNLAIRIGEGGTPTWETANYWTSGYFACTYASGASSGFNSGTTSSSFFGPYGYFSGLTETSEVQVWISNNGSSSLPKLIQSMATVTNGSNYDCNQTQGGSYTGDTNPVTAIQIYLSSGDNITSGTCSLYGMN